MVSHGKTTATKIASGADDSTIRKFATGVKDLHGPVLLRFGFEMDQRAHAFGTPSQFIAAWRHVYNVFQKVGATNVRFVWCPTAAAFVNGVAGKWYPGDAYVDWIGVDGYNRYTTTHEWKSFGALFGPFYTFGSSHSQPLVVAESGTTEDAGHPGRKGTWFLDAASWLKAHPRIKGWVYNSAIGTMGYDNRVETSSSSLSDYKKAGKESYFQH